MVAQLLLFIIAQSQPISTLLDIANEKTLLYNNIATPLSNYYTTINYNVYTPSSKANPLPFDLSRNGIGYSLGS